MTLRHLFTAVLLSAPVALGAVTPSDIEPYVYPNNSAASPASMIYLADGVSYASLVNGTRIVKYDVVSGKETATILDVTATRDNQLESIDGFLMSPNEQYILVWTDKQMLYRRSFTARYYLYEVRHNVLKPLSEKTERQRSPIWSPDGSMVAFVADNNIHIAKLAYGTEVAVTTDGKINNIINGVPDWVYEEEFDTTCSMAWAPDCMTLCYLKYDETKVPVYSFKLYEGTCNPNPDYALYPGLYEYKYPVAGQPNSVVSLYSYDVDNRATKRVELPDARIEYIPRLAYGPTPERLIVTTLNRAQNRMEIYTVNPKSTVVKSIYVDESKDGWIDPTAWELTTLLTDGFVVASERSGYNQLYKYSYSGALVSQLTSGNEDVQDYYGYDAVRMRHYYQSTSGPLNRVVSYVDKKGVTVNMGESTGTTSAVFSPGKDFYMLSYSDISTPPVYTLYGVKGAKKLRVLQDNAAYRSRLRQLPVKEFFTMNSESNVLNGYMIKPADFSASRRYPVIMSQYSGPGSQEVLNKWSYGWEAFYASQGYIIVCVDGRGTGGRGASFKHSVYRRLGYFETIDQVAAARYVGTLPYVDSSRIGIYGWSYGGYETLMAASAVDAPYAAAVAVAPVTSWRFYDTVYTERYMLTPRENEDGYNEGAPLSYTHRMNTPLLIMHGTADDNVHLMNTIQYVSSLQSNNRLCDMLLFPNMNHSIYGCGARALVYTKMLDFFDRNLKNR